MCLDAVDAVCNLDGNADLSAFKLSDSTDLILKCTAAARDGADFPSVWDRVLKRHALVVGPPIQTYEDERPLLEVRLISGQRLVYDSTSNKYALLRAVRRPF
jgi:hypothetical protein